MAKPTMTYVIAMAASRDAGNRHMRTGGRTVWAVADWNAACETFERLWPKPETATTNAQPAQEPRAGVKRTRGKDGR